MSSLGLMILIVGILIGALLSLAVLFVVRLRVVNQKMDDYEKSMVVGEGHIDKDTVKQRR